jgi:hypothetical protein
MTDANLSEFETDITKTPQWNTMRKIQSVSYQGTLRGFHHFAPDTRGRFRPISEVRYAIRERAQNADKSRAGMMQERQDSWKTQLGFQEPWKKRNRTSFYVIRMVSTVVNNMSNSATTRERGRARGGFRDSGQKVVST